MKKKKGTEQTKRTGNNQKKPERSPTLNPNYAKTCAKLFVFRHLVRVEQSHLQISGLWGAPASVNCIGHRVRDVALTSRQIFA